MSALCKDIQDALVASLAGRAELTGRVLGRRQKTIVNDIAAALQKLGSCVYVFPAVPARINSNNPGPYIDSLLLRARAIEHPSLNASGPDAYELVEYLLRYMDGLQLTITGGQVVNPIRFEATPVQVVDDAEELVQYDVIGFTSHGLEPRA